MKKEFIKYGFFTLVVLLIFIFVYPTIYQYDKFNQKIPVRINRITGTTELLYSDGWSKAVTAQPEIPKTSEMDQFKKEMDDKFKGLQISIEKDVSDKLSAQVIAEIKDDIAKAKTDIADYKKSQLDPNNSFTVGSSMDEVKKIMGVPTKTYKDPFGDGGAWYYDFSSVSFKNNKVVSWDNTSKNLKLK